MKDIGDWIKNRILGLMNCKRSGDEEKPNQKTERAASDMGGNQVSVCTGSQRKTLFQGEGSDQECQMSPRPRWVSKLTTEFCKVTITGNFHDSNLSVVVVK